MARGEPEATRRLPIGTTIGVARLVDEPSGIRNVEPTDSCWPMG